MISSGLVDGHLLLNADGVLRVTAKPVLLPLFRLAPPTCSLLKHSSHSQWFTQPCRLALGSKERSIHALLHFPWALSVTFHKVYAEVVSQPVYHPSTWPTQGLLKVPQSVHTSTVLEFMSFWKQFERCF
ncbi:hypothetical protein IF2G_06460 [Cordyceps javanica]|nr:hypothetical protein IF2G_06460 [Cordyceps javanica]